MGIGTFNGLDGEMIFLDGRCFCLRPNAEAIEVEDDAMTPFAMCIDFSGHMSEVIDRPVSFTDFEHFLLDLIPSQNLIYAIRIDGKFDLIKFRSVPRQANYSPLAEIAKVQTVSSIETVDATIMGFYTPRYLASVHMPGLHLHVISHDKRHGGHLLGAAMRNVTVRLQQAQSVELGLPLTLDFLTYEQRRDVQADLDQVER
jgi:acetolactate decarboxylase